MPGRRHAPTDAAEALVSVAPLVSRWIERLLAGHEPPLTVAQFLALRAIAAEGVSGSELARRAGVSGPAVSQLVAGLADGKLLVRHELMEDRRRHTLALTALGEQTLASAQTLLRERLSTLLAGLPRPEADALARALPRVEATLSGAPPPRRPPHPPKPPPRGPRPGPRRGP
ncbi:MAG TPA: MarR family winged helix-turn-helix transcriptional regulator [Solirubrobacteraceae bacterium]|jgi:DNA-binding MarR family transcriptional regulator|nr:MarR family winged helix-turn-helix transcriptional regulator [Solirubrobacteraceae bacterium]